MIREINSDDWQDFCQRLSRQRQGAQVTIEAIEPDGLKTEKVGNSTLESIAFDRQNSCNDVISLRVRNQREITYDIIDPVHILLEETSHPGDFNPVRIDGENGTTYLTFHPAIHVQMLEGLRGS
jgi:hypothetical protein